MSLTRTAHSPPMENMYKAPGRLRKLVSESQLPDLPERQPNGSPTLLIAIDTFHRSFSAALFPQLTRVPSLKPQAVSPSGGPEEEERWKRAKTVLDRFLSPNINNMPDLEEKEREIFLCHARLLENRRTGGDTKEVGSRRAWLTSIIDQLGSDTSILSAIAFRLTGKDMKVDGNEIISCDYPDAVLLCIDRSCGESDVLSTVIRRVISLWQPKSLSIHNYYEESSFDIDRSKVTICSTPNCIYDVTYHYCAGYVVDDDERKRKFHSSYKGIPVRGVVEDPFEDKMAITIYNYSAVSSAYDLLKGYEDNGFEIQLLPLEARSSEELVDQCVSLMNSNGEILLHKAIGPFVRADHEGDIFPKLVANILVRKDSRRQVDEKVLELSKVCPQRSSLFRIVEVDDSSTDKPVSAIALESRIFDFNTVFSHSVKDTAPVVSTIPISNLGKFLLYHYLEVSSDDIFYVKPDVPLFEFDVNPLVFAGESAGIIVKEVHFSATVCDTVDNFFELLEEMHVIPYPRSGTNPKFVDTIHTEGAIQVCEEILNALHWSARKGDKFDKFLYVRFCCRALRSLAAMNYHYSLVTKFTDFFREMHLSDKADIVTKCSYNVDDLSKFLESFDDCGIDKLGYPKNRTFLRRIDDEVEIVRKWCASHSSP